MQFDFPYHFDGRDRTAETDEAGHVRNLIELLLFTNPGERVNRPDFGGGVNQLVFAAASAEAAATAGFMIHGALQTHLGQRIEVEDVAARADGPVLTITIIYRLLRSGATDRVDLTLGETP
jgi:phage baseplate assembly protein W